MQVFSKLSAAFCLACICAESICLLTDAGWARRCIKTASGLYILVVLFSALRGVSPALSEWKPNEQPPADLTAEQEAFVLSNAAKELEHTLSEQCMQKFGIPIKLRIELQQGADGTVFAETAVIFSQDAKETVRSQVTDWLEQELGTAPDWREGELT